MSDKPLPEGWRIVSLHNQNADGTLTTDIVPTRGRAKDEDIAQADMIRVSYTSRRTGITAYRTIHGASDKQDVGDQIRKVTRVVSPV